MNALGWVHVVFAAVAVVSGGVVFLLPKGTRWHRTIGHLYGTSMVGLIATAFSIYDLFGGFGVFHVAGLVSAVTLVGGMAPVLTRRPRETWMGRHAGWMTGSYIGLMCAFVAEVGTRWAMPRLATRLPEGWIWPAFWIVVVGASVVTGVVGGRLTARWLPRALERTPQALRRARLADRERLVRREPEGHEDAARA